MTRAAVILAVVSALCLGASLGFVSGVLFSHHMLRGGPPLGFGSHGFRFERFGRFRPPRPDGIPPTRVLVPHLTRLLELTPAQADAIRAEIDRARDEFSNLRDSLHVRIERHLTVVQRERWRLVVREQFPGEPGGRDPHTLRADPGREGDR